MRYKKNYSQYKDTKRVSKAPLNVKFEKGHIRFYKLNHHMVVSEFIRGMKYALLKGVKKFYVDFSYVDAQVFPNVVVPLSALFGYYGTQGCEFQYIKMPRFFESMNFPTPQKYVGLVVPLEKSLII